MVLSNSRLSCSYSSTTCACCCAVGGFLWEAWHLDEDCLWGGSLMQNSLSMLDVWKAPKYVRKHFEALMVTTPSNHSLSCLSLASSRCSLHSRILLSSVMSSVNLSWSCSTCSLVQISFMRSRSSGLMLPRSCNRMALSVHNGRHAIANNRKWMGEVRLMM